MLALWEGEGVPSEKLFASPLKWDAPREEGGTSREQCGETAGVLQRGDRHSFPWRDIHLGSRPTDPALLWAELRGDGGIQMGSSVALQPVGDGTVSFPWDTEASQKVNVLEQSHRYSRGFSKYRENNIFHINIPTGQRIISISWITQLLL